MMNRKEHIVRDALFLDIPYIVDSALRHVEYRLNRLHRPRIGAPPIAKRYVELPSFALLVAVAVFAAYGPTFSALCGFLEPSLYSSGQVFFGWLCKLLAVAQLMGTSAYVDARIERRFAKKGLPRGPRWAVVRVVFFLVLVAWSFPFLFLGEAMIAGAEQDGCRPGAPDWPSGVQVAALIATLGVSAWGSLRASTLRGRIGSQALAIAALVALVSSMSLLPGGLWTEAHQVPYPHVFGFVAVGMAAIAWIASWLIHIPFGSLTRREYCGSKAALREVELFPKSREDPELSPRRIFGGLVVGVLQKPAQFLLLPAFAVLLVPEQFLWHACIAGTVASSLLITASTLTVRWDRMAQYLRRYLLLGIPFAVSAAAIVVAVLRVLDVQYVTTLLNMAPFGVLFTWTTMAYAVGWWFEYHVNSLLAAKLLSILGASGRSDNEVVGYDASRIRFSEKSRVEVQHRYVTGHGLGELVVVGQVRETSSGDEITAFHAYSFIEFFSTLLGKKYPKEAQEVARRIQLYFAMVNVLLVLGFGLLAWHWGRGDRLNTVSAVVEARSEPPTGAKGTMDLAAALRTPVDGPLPDSAIVVAASGGGTRAALYAASVLQGLHRLGVDSRVVLLSGVSGGGVASAYFYGHRAELIRRDERTAPCLGVAAGDVTPWECFRRRMAMPFIGDVLRGASEWRIQSDLPLGILLSESFERRLFAHGKEQLRFNQEPEIGLILNSTATGVPLQDMPMIDGTFIRLPTVGATRCEDDARPTSAGVGGRLAFSNIRDIGAFQKFDENMPSIRMPFVVVRDPDVKLAQAAALNANFPPVFPNARVNLTGFSGGDATKCDTRSYFVTDGGTTENLGLVSALLALDSALDSIGAGDPRNDAHASTQPPRLRDVDIVLAEASAFSFDYSQDRGVGAAAGDGKERLTGRLTLELIDRVQARMRPAKVRIHDLSLPRAFRSRGGFGTHWAFPGSVRIENPLVTPLLSTWNRVVSQYGGTDRQWVTLDRKHLFIAWDALFDDESICDRRSWPSADHPTGAQDLAIVSGWICGHDPSLKDAAKPDPQVARWQALRTLMKAPVR